MLFDILRGVADGGDLLSRIVGDFHAEFFFESHHEFDDVEAVSAQIVDEAGFLGDLVALDAEMFDDNLLHAVGGIAHIFPLETGFENFPFALMNGAQAGKGQRTICATPQIGGKSPVSIAQRSSVIAMREKKSRRACGSPR